uniref:Lymphoid-restricted membrane protein n=1 Tax=Oryzias latipes TaxID=8090 RepID=A0A3P9K9Z2_ORYLA
RNVGVSPPRRHNPVDSICRKLQTIQWRGDREPNSPFQIPKLSSSSYDSPQCSLRSNLEAILKKGAGHGDGEGRGSRSMGMPSSVASQRGGAGHYNPPCTPTHHRATPTNVTYTITSTLGERHRGEGGDLRQTRAWQRNHSTPSTQPQDSPYFTFTRGPQEEQSESSGATPSPHLCRTFTPSQSNFSYNLNFCPAGASEGELPYPALVVKRLSMGDGGMSPNGTGMAEISLICEENLLDTIFHACDTQRRGKVYVSHIVDYLRHTTSRSSEDSGLEELCNMLDPERKDVSIDLDTYHAVMREWIDDCRNHGYSLTRNSVKVRDGVKSMLLNMTSGSLEAFGGEPSKVEFETSELVYCVADLQMSNQKLQEEVRRLKQVVEAMEESNQKLAEENEELRSQARITQQMAQKEKLLEEEVEEMKATLSCTEEGRARASARSKHVERENQSLIAKISSLQDENFKITMETDELQKRIKELCDVNADLQVFGLLHLILLYSVIFTPYLDRQVEELKATIEEYTAITQLLRTEKSKLENQMQMILPDLAGLSLCGAYRLNQSSSGSLQTELALAQSPLEAPHLSAATSQASALDETLDREVLLLLQGPDPEHMALEFRNLLNKMVTLPDYFLGENSTAGSGVDPHLQVRLDARRADWAASLDQLAGYTDSLEKELIKTASNMRRSRTEILHLSVKVQEQESQKRQLCEELERLKAPPDGTEHLQQNQAMNVVGGSLLVTAAEFQRLSLGFKCDMFTLEKRLKLEQRSRDLAEENIRKEVSSCQGLLQALTPLCEDETQSMEIIQRLQKNLDILIQSTNRVSSRSEMLGAIHQENRIGKAVEVMIQHVENLKRTYTKEHAELLELRQALAQGERSFGGEKGWISDQTPVQPPTPIPAASRRASAVAPKASRGVWLWLAIMVVLAGLLALLACLVMQPAADAAPMGTGDSWMTIQQLLWPYTGLRHNAQPPV